MNGISVGES